jgi:two-component system NtrC family response regulator
MTSEKARSLLIVEDDLALQKQIKWSLDRFDSVTAHDRESALLQLRKNTPAVVTMDLGLPPDADSVSEGFRLLEQIKTTRPMPCAPLPWAPMIFSQNRSNPSCST